MDTLMLFVLPVVAVGLVMAGVFVVHGLLRRRRLAARRRQRERMAADLRLAQALHVPDRVDLEIAQGARTEYVYKQDDQQAEADRWLERVDQEVQRERSDRDGAGFRGPRI